MPHIKPLSRRQFVKGTGALIVSFSFAGPVARALAQAPDPSNAGFDEEPQAASLDSWLAVAQDGTITVFTSKVELGTGVQTALGQIVAEELDVPFERVTLYTGDTAKSVDQAVTAASRTLERGGPQLRGAAAAARQELLKLASARLQAPIEKLTVTDGVVSVGGNPAARVSYGELIGGRRFNVKITATGTGWDMKVAPEVRPKDPKQYKIVGKSIPRVDLPPKFTGEFTYVQDVRVPGMLHGRVVRPPTINSKPESIDESSIKGIPGVVKVVTEGNFVGVVATTEWSAIQAARKLKVNWSTPATKLPASAEEVYEYLRNTKSFRDINTAKKGDVERAFADAEKNGAKILEATYRWPFQLHGMIGPSCAVADVRGDRATIWAGSQGPFGTRRAAAQILNVPEKNVRVLYREGSGCYGRLSPDDAPEDAVVMSRAVGKPVRVQWTREDEHAWEPKGPAQLTSVRAALDAQGRILAWDYIDRSFPWTEAAGMPLLASRQIGIQPKSQGSPNGAGGGGELYEVENQNVVASLIPWVQPDPTPLRTSNLRAPGELARVFASESFMDELAAAARVDPLQFRLRHLAGNTRAVEALQAAAQQAAWQERPSPAPPSSGRKALGRGLAISDRSKTIVAAVAEVEVDKSSGRVAVKRITIAHDCGLIVNPDGLRNQIEGNVIQGVSRTLMEEVKFDSSGIKTLDWRSHPIITFKEIPEVEIVLLNRPEMPALGGGEPSISPVPAAIANAIFDATGTRLREIPLTPERVLRAMNQTAPASQMA